MADRYPRPVFLDATVLSNYASTDSIGFLVSILDSPVVVPAVRDEIERGHRFGHDYLATALEAFDDGLRVGDDPAETAAGQLRDRLDPGEADALRGAVEHTGHSRPTISPPVTSPTSSESRSRVLSGCSWSASNTGASTAKQRTSGSKRGATSADTTRLSRVSVSLRN